MRRFIIIALILSFVTVPVCAQETTESKQSGTQIEQVNPSPRMVVSKTVTEVRYYSSHDAAPASISYNQYDPVVDARFTGTLYLKSLVYTGYTWKATYSGTVYGNV